MTDPRATRAPHSGAHLTDERCTEMLNGLVAKPRLDSILLHVRNCPSCETLFQTRVAERERLRAGSRPRRRADGSIELMARIEPAEEDTNLAELLAPPTVRVVKRKRRSRRRTPVANRWRLALAGVTAAAAVLAVFVIPNWSREDDLAYWLPSGQPLAVVRSAPDDPDGSLRRGLAAYGARDAEAAARYLVDARARDAGEDVRRLYLASAYALSDQPAAALDVLDALDVPTLPEPYRRQARWVRYTALVATGQDAEAGSVLDRLVDEPGEIGERARRQADR